MNTNKYKVKFTFLTPSKTTISKFVEVKSIITANDPKEAIDKVWNDIVGTIKSYVCIQSSVKLIVKN